MHFHTSWTEETYTTSNKKFRPSAEKMFLGKIFNCPSESVLSDIYSTTQEQL